MKIGLDVMGGDYAPEVTIEGALLSLDKLASEDRIFLFGPEDIITEKIHEKGMIHNSICPSKILTGFDKMNKLYLIGLYK